MDYIADLITNAKSQLEMKKNILLPLLLMILSLSAFAQNLKYEKLFGKNDVDKWTIPDDLGCFNISKGILTIKSEPTKKGSILWTKKQYKNFVFETEFKMGDGTVDSGIFLRSEKNQIQIGISGSLKRDMTASPYIIGLGYPTEAQGVKDILKPKDWNKMKVSIKDKTFTVWLNDKEVMTYTTTEIPVTGSIGLQLHPKNEMTIYYKNCKVAEI
jgi:hypothetical protein